MESGSSSGSGPSLAGTSPSSLGPWRFNQSPAMLHLRCSIPCWNHRETVALLGPVITDHYLGGGFARLFQGKEREGSGNYGSQMQGLQQEGEVP